MPSIAALISRDTVSHQDFLNAYPEAARIIEEIKNNPEVCEWCDEDVNAHADDCPTLFYPELA